MKIFKYSIALVIVLIISLNYLTGCSKNNDIVIDNPYYVENSTDILTHYPDEYLYITYGKSVDCHPVYLRLYNDKTYELFTIYEIASHYAAANDIGPNFIKSIKGSVQVDFDKILADAVLEESLSSSEDLIKYKISDNKGHVYVITSDKADSYLDSLLDEINVDLTSCAVPIYLK